MLRADIPGVHKSEIRVSTDGEVVRFGHQAHPDRQAKDEAEPGVFHRCERVSSFRGRALRLPDNSDMAAITAKVCGAGVCGGCVVRWRGRRCSRRNPPLTCHATSPTHPTCPPTPTHVVSPPGRQYEDGVLELTIPKKQAAPPKVEGRAIAVE